MRWSALGSLQTAVPGASLYSQHPMNSAASPSASPSASTQRRARLLTAPVLPALLALAAPNVALALMQALVSFADGWFIGQLGTEGLAGVALVFPIVILMQMMSAGAMGGGVIFDMFGSYDIAWRIGVSIGLLAGFVQIVFGGPSRPKSGSPALAAGEPSIGCSTSTPRAVAATSIPMPG